MEKSTVYFTDFRCPVGTSQLDKLKKLCVAAGIKNIDMDGKFVAIKMHFGELGNLAFFRPNYAPAHSFCFPGKAYYSQSEMAYHPAPYTDLLPLSLSGRDKPAG